MTWGIGQMLLILIHHITTAPDIDTDTYLSSVGYACFERMPEMIIYDPICMGHGAIIMDMVDLVDMVVKVAMVDLMNS